MGPPVSVITSAAQLRTLCGEYPGREEGRNSGDAILFSATCSNLLGMGKGVGGAMSCKPSYQVSEFPADGLAGGSVKKCSRRIWGAMDRFFMMHRMISCAHWVVLWWRASCAPSSRDDLK